MEYSFANRMQDRKGAGCEHSNFPMKFESKAWDTGLHIQKKHTVTCMEGVCLEGLLKRCRGIIAIGYWLRESKGV